MAAFRAALQQRDLAGMTAGPRRVRTAHTAGARLSVLANKKGDKRTQVVLMEDMPAGAAGTLTFVQTGYYRNYLQPRGLAQKATAGILEEFQRKEQETLAAAQAVKDKALALATALSTLGKFTIKKTAGKDKAIFGSVTAQDVVDVVKAQTNQELDKKTITVPDVSELGTYACSVKLHPEVTATFNLVVQPEKQG